MLNSAYAKQSPIRAARATSQLRGPTCNIRAFSRSDLLAFSDLSNSLGRVCSRIMAKLRVLCVKLKKQQKLGHFYDKKAFLHIYQAGCEKAEIFPDVSKVA